MKRWRSQTHVCRFEEEGHIVRYDASRVEVEGEKWSGMHCWRSPWSPGEVEKGYKVARRRTSEAEEGVAGKGLDVDMSEAGTATASSQKKMKLLQHNGRARNLDDVQLHTSQACESKERGREEGGLCLGRKCGGPEEEEKQRK